MKKKNPLFIEVKSPLSHVDTASVLYWEQAPLIPLMPNIDMFFQGNLSHTQLSLLACINGVSIVKPVYFLDIKGVFLKNLEFVTDTQILYVHNLTFLG